MRAWRRFVARLHEWRHAETVDADLQDELDSHLAFLIDDHLRRGLSPEEARRAALLELGGMAQTRALASDARGFRVLDALTTDVRLALRQLRQTPGFTLAAVLTLALGIGANTAIFSLVDAVLLEPLPYADPDRLVSLWEEVNDDALAPNGTATPTPERTVVAPANLADYAARTTLLASLAAYTPTGANLTGLGPAERLSGEAVSPNYLSTLGVRPTLGRDFLPGDDQPGRNQVVIVSQTLWEQRLGGRPVDGSQSLRLSDTTYSVIGVMPPAFVGLTQTDQTDRVSFWVPLTIDPEALTNRHEHLVSVVARLTDDASPEAARAQLAAVSDALAREFPDAARTRASLAVLRADQVSGVRTMLMVLIAGVGLVLLVACVNVAGLLLVRAVGRRREMAVRFALGASRARVVFEQGVQSLVLATIGGLTGLAVGAGAVRLLVSRAPASLPYVQDASIDLRVIAFTCLVVIITSLVFGVWPALQAARVDPLSALKDGARSVSEGWVVRRRSALLVAEVALSAVLLAGALLMVRSLLALDRVDLGFNPENVIAASVTLPPERYDTPEARLAFFESLASALRRSPGVVDVAYGNRLPLRGNWISGMLLDTEDTFRQAGFQAVSADYFKTFGIPLLRGRALTDDDRAGSAAVALVNESFAREMLDDADPIGHTVRRAPSLPPITIVGVVSDVRRTGRADATGTRAADVTPQVYLPAAQTTLYPLPLRELAVRTQPEATNITQTIRAAVASLDIDQPVTAVRSLEETLNLGSAQKRFQATLFVLFAAVAFGLALVGVYGVVAYSVSLRSAEIALRLALGSTRRQIVATVARATSAMVAGGVLLGLVGAVGASRLIASLLFETAPTDGVTYVVTGVGLLAAGVGAAVLAGLRATRVNPMTALK